jgi:hypothetical protein
MLYSLNSFLYCPVASTPVSCSDAVQNAIAIKTKCAVLAP